MDIKPPLPRRDSCQQTHVVRCVVHWRRHRPNSPYRHFRDRGRMPSSVAELRGGPQRWQGHTIRRGAERESRGAGVPGSGGKGTPRTSTSLQVGIIGGLRDIAGGLTGDHDPPLADTPPSAIIVPRCERPPYGRAGRWRSRTPTIPCIVLVAPDSSSWRWPRSAPIRLAVCCHCRGQPAIASRPASTAPVDHSIA